MASKRHFRELLDFRMAGEKYLCIQLDLLPTAIYNESLLNPLMQKQIKMGEDRYDAQLTVARMVVDQTRSIAAAYRLNADEFAHYEGGVLRLKQIVDFIHSWAPDVPVILEHRASSPGRAAYFAFEVVGADALLTGSEFGLPGIEKALSNPERGLIIELPPASHDGAEYVAALLSPYYVEDAVVPEDTEALQQLAGANDNCWPAPEYTAFRVGIRWAPYYHDNCMVSYTGGYTADLSEIRRIVGPGMPIFCEFAVDNPGRTQIHDFIRCGINVYGGGLLISSPELGRSMNVGRDAEVLHRIVSSEFRMLTAKS